MPSTIPTATHQNTILNMLDAEHNTLITTIFPTPYSHVVSEQIRFPIGENVAVVKA
jgi:hypothetical protein